MEKLYRLEFNEKQQKFHLDNETHKPDTFGWFTVFEHCSDIEFHVFECYLNTRYEKPYKKSQILKCANEIEIFTFALLLKDLRITFKK